MTDKQDFSPENDSEEASDPSSFESSDPQPEPDEVNIPIEEAHAAALSLEVRALDGAEFEAAPDEAAPPPAAQPATTSPFTLGDALVPPSNRFRKGEWQHEFSGHEIALEIGRTEAEVRRLFEERDPRRKRKITGTRKWQELEEDIIALKFTGRVDEAILREITRLISYRHYLYSQLRFVASTRATWNT